MCEVLVACKPPKRATPQEKENQGDNFFVEKQWKCAEDAFSAALQLLQSDDTDEYKASLLLKRAQTLFAQDRWEFAKKDALLAVKNNKYCAASYQLAAEALIAQARHQTALLVLDCGIAACGGSSSVGADTAGLTELKTNTSNTLQASAAGGKHSFGYPLVVDPLCTDESQDAALDPHAAWSAMAHQQTVNTLPLVVPVDEITENSITVCCISDTHRKHRDVKFPEGGGDILIHAGDITTKGEREVLADFVKWIEEAPFKHKVVIGGNHDVSMNEEYYSSHWQRYHHKRINVDKEMEQLKKVCHYLLDTKVELPLTTPDGKEDTVVVVYGSPWQPWYKDMCWNAKRGYPIRDKWDRIPSSTAGNGVDILVTHGPPCGHGDLLTDEDPPQHAGCVDLLHAVQQRVKPQLHVFGHLHEGYGKTTDGQTVYVNAALMDEETRELGKAPVLCHITPRRRTTP
eukprot:TRINITY_DN20969_c0_g1_i1.p1 TRINITY_DN20969_c0_g1~~TRINITY_DN20969_c0_g1_i1.p1  ORF type:complete len:458 (+),score=59.92 TRINITY_DN20969_c0_g1_i1:90-1463(+)